MRTDRYAPIPDAIIEAFRNYSLHGRIPGGFCYAVLSNDLRDAVARADGVNIRLLPEIVWYCYNHIPSMSWGSKKKVAEWAKHKGLHGQHGLLKGLCIDRELDPMYWADKVAISAHIEKEAGQ
jgi:hypothetical protein